MEKFTKITVGFVAQSYKKDTDGKFVCTRQDFIAGDHIDYEDMDGNAITAPEHVYQSFEMTSPDQAEYFISEQCCDSPAKKLPVNILLENSKLWLQPKGYGDKTSIDGQGFPVGLEIWEGRLRLIVFDDINIEDAKIIDMEKAKEANRNICNWCDKHIDDKPVRYNDMLFCCQSCLDKCRAIQ